jgi:hypothetical protein
MYLVDPYGGTLKELSRKLHKHSSSESLLVKIQDVRCDADKGVILLAKKETPLTTRTLSLVGEYLDIPAPWMRREDTDVIATVINMKAERTPTAEFLVRVDEEGIIDVREPNAKTFESRDIVEVAAKVLGDDAPVIDFRSDAMGVGLDVAVKDGAARGIGGDPKVGDLTKAGLRFGRNVRQNLVPWVQPYMYRLACTNGMEVMMSGLKVEGRGNSVDDVLTELEAMAELAFSRVEADIAHFYDMRNEKVAQPERTLLRTAGEAKVSDRIRMQLMETLPTIIPESGQVTMFDIVNLVTNVANAPHLNNFGSRRVLQRLGGSMVTTHVERCGTCASRLVH